MQNFRYRQNRYNFNTTDDCSVLEKYKSNDEVLYLIKHTQDIWKILNETNTYICQCDTDFIIKNKPTFDKQKLILIKIDLLVNNILSNGLKKSFKDNQIKYNDSLLDVNTFHTEWNQKANIINKLILDIIDTNNIEYITINVINNNTNIEKNNTNTKYNYKQNLSILFIILFMITIIYHYIKIINNDNLTNHNP